MITTIIFDLGDVFLTGAKGVWKHLPQETGSNISDDDLFITEFNQLFLAEITEVEYWQAVIKKSSWNTSVNELKNAIRKNFQEIKGTRKIIEKLKQNGYKLGLLSNHAKEWIEYCQINYQYHHLFHTVLYSYEAKLSKPDKRMFKLILKKLKAKPEECLFIDDYIKNIEASQELGFNTIHFTSPKNLKKRLKELNIK